MFSKIIGNNKRDLKVVYTGYSALWEWKVRDSKGTFLLTLSWDCCALDLRCKTEYLEISQSSAPPFAPIISSAEAGREGWKLLYFTWGFLHRWEIPRNHRAALAVSRTFNADQDWKISKIISIYSIRIPWGLLVIFSFKMRRAIEILSIIIYITSVGSWTMLMFVRRPQSNLAQSPRII